MSRIVPLVAAVDVAIHGAKAVGLGQALRDGLPVPGGFALCGPLVEAVASGDEAAEAEVLAAVGSLPGPFAVRSSAIDEDGDASSFAGQHLTLLNVPGAAELPEALSWLEAYRRSEAYAGVLMLICWGRKP